MRTLGILIAMVLMSFFGSTRAGEEVPEIAKVLKSGHGITLTKKYYCKEEYLMRGLLRLIEVSDERSSLKIIRGNSGDGACEDARYDNRDKAKKIRATYIRSFSPPLFVRGVNDKTQAWVIEIEVDGERRFTYLTEVEISGLKSVQLRKASAATK